MHSIFSTIQGEGPFGGTPAIFVRLYGCNLCCPACDTEYSDHRQAYSTDDLFQAIYTNSLRNNAPPSLVVFTGGEPMRQNILPIVQKLLLLTKVQIETNGTYFSFSLMQSGAHITVSPKTPKIHADWDNIHFVDKENISFKYVLDHLFLDAFDGLPVDVLRSGLRPARPPAYLESNQIFVQPIDMKDNDYNDLSLQATVNSSIQHGYRLSLQIHKIIQLP